MYGSGCARHGLAGPGAQRESLNRIRPRGELFTLGRYRACSVDFVPVWGWESRSFEADGSDEGIEIVDEALIQAIELRSPLGFEPGICFDGAEKACREWGVNAFEELQEDEADRVPLREELIASGIRELGDEAFGAEFR